MKLPNLQANHIKTYLEETLGKGSASTYERKLASLKKFFNWAEKEGYITGNPLEEYLVSQDNQIINKINKAEEAKAFPTSKPQPFYSSLQNRIVARYSHKPRFQNFLYKAFYSRPKWYQTYHSLAVSSYLHLAILVIFSSALAFGIYDQFKSQATQIQAFPTALVRPNRYLSFQGRLTNQYGNPITVATDIVFKLHTAATDGSELWSSGTCSITPDGDGIFSTVLGSTCGTELASSIFSENAAVWLSVTVGTDAEATPRIQIATVAYALNAETLQGYPATASAVANTIPVINNAGNLVIGVASPKIQAISASGAFVIEGQTGVTLAATDTSNSSININPDGTGTLNLTFEGAAPGGSVGGFVNAINTNITSGALYFGQVASAATGYDLLQLKSGSSPTEKFAVDYAGNTDIAGTLNVGSTLTLTGMASGAIYSNSGAITQENYLSSSRGGTGANNSTAAQYSVPYYTATGVLGGAVAPDTGGYVLSTNSTGSAPTWIAMTATGTNYWQLNTLTLSPIISTYDLAVGGTATGSSKFQVMGTTGNISTANNTIDWTLNSAADALNFDADTLSIDASANRVGIGDASPLATLTVGSGDLFQVAGASGDITTAGDLNVNGDNINADGTLAILGATGLTLQATTGTVTLDSIAASQIINVGASDVARTINLGTGTGIDTINIGTGATGVDDINIGTVNASTIDLGGASAGAVNVQSSGALTLHGETNSAIDFLNFDVATTGTVTIAASQSYTGAGAVTLSSGGSSGLTLDSLSGVITINTDDDLIPTLGAGSADLGSDAARWDNLYATQVCLSGDCQTAWPTAGGTNYWQLNTLTLSPIISTYDLAVGGTATGSSKFQVMGTTGNISTANNTIDWTLNSAADALNFDANTLSIDAASNRVGIGTAAPASSLDVAGGAMATEGVDKVTNGNFSADSNWNKGTGWTISGTAIKTAGVASDLSQDTTEAAGKMYHITFDYTRTAGGLTVSIGGVTYVHTFYSGDGAKDISIYSTGTGDLTFSANSTFAGTIDNVIVKEVTTSLANTTNRDSAGTIKSELRVAGTSNTFMGLNAGMFNFSGTGNTALGAGALTYNVSGINNTAIGISTLLSNTTGNNNVALGNNALEDNTYGYDNIGIGSIALYSNTNGVENVAIGSSALAANTTGYENVAIGAYALTANSNSMENVAVGAYSLSNGSQSGGYNVAVGTFALDSLTSGSENVAIGYLAGDDLTTGTYNVFLGQNAGDNAAQKVDATNSMALGYGAYTTASNQIVLGNTSVAETYINGILKLGTTGITHTANITVTGDAMISGDMELDGTLFLDNGIIANVAGTSAITLTSSPTTSYNTLSSAVWKVDNPGTLSNPGLAALTVNQNTAADIFRATASESAKFAIHNDGSITLAGMATTTNTSEGTIYYDTDIDRLYLRTGGSAWARLATDMTKYSNTNASVANLSYLDVDITNNPDGFSDYLAQAWVYDSAASQWKPAENYTTTIIQNLQNQFNDATSSGIIRTQTEATDVSLSPSVDVGTGADGSLTVSTDTNINSTIAGFSCADGGRAVNYSVSSLTSTAATLSTTPSAGCLSVGDEVLLINLQGSNGLTLNTGNYETLRVSSVSTNVVNFTSSKTKYYGDGATGDTNLGTGETNQKVMLQRVPNYTSVTVNSTYNLYPNAYSYTTGKGGVLFFRATGTVTVSGTIHANAKGYIAGAGASAYNTSSYPGQSQFYTSATDGRGGNSSSTAGVTGTFSGGGGGGKTDSSAGGAGGSGSSIAGAGGGGGGGSVYRYDLSNAGFGGGGGGGGHATGGYGGNGGTGGITGTNGGATSGAGATAGVESSTNSGGGGGGGAYYGTSNLSDLTLGSGGAGGGGGASAAGASEAGAAGGNGGGIVTISANQISVSGGVTSTGANGSDPTTRGGGGGGGAGGAVKLMANTLTLGTNLVSASGGTGGNNTSTPDNNGGIGASGYTAIYYSSSYSGSANSPTPTYTQQPYYPYGLYHSPVIATPNAISYDLLRWEATPSAYGKVSIQTRSGNSTNPKEGSWEVWRPYTENTDYKVIQSADTHGDFAGTGATVADGTLARDVEYFENEDEPTAGNTTKFTNTTAGAGYADDTLGAAVDISTFDYLTFWVYATASGNTVKIGIGEAGHDEQTETVTIDAASTWQKVYWDLSDIAAASRNAIQYVRITNLNNPWNTIGFDNIRAEKLLTNQDGSVISSTPNNYFQYRVIFSTTNTSYQPKIENLTFGYKNGYKVVQIDTDTLRLYNYTGSTQNLRLDAVVFGADLAEWYPTTDETIEAGDVVAISGQMNDKNVPQIEKANSQNKLMGIISTQAGQELGLPGEDKRLVGLSGRVPIKIAPDSPAILAGDFLTASSNYFGMATKAVNPGQVVARAFEDWTPDSDKTKIDALINLAWYDPDIYLTSDASLNIEKVAGNYQLAQTNSDGTIKVVDRISALGKLIAANIKAGAIETQEFTSNSFKAFQGSVDNLLVNSGLVSSNIKTNIISPLADSNLVFDLNNSTSTDSASYGKLIVKGEDEKTVAAIDELGNATFSGTLYADQIVARNGILGEIQTASSSGITREEVEKMLAEAETNTQDLTDITNANIFTASSAANLNELAVNDLFVIGRLTATNLSLTENFTLGSDLIMQSSLGENGQLINTLDTLSAPLSIQSLAMAPLQIMAGKFIIETNGDVKINGNLYLAGNIESYGLTLRPNSNNPESAFGKLLSVKDNLGQEVAQITASGSANFTRVTTNSLVIAGNSASPSAEILNGEISTNATAGKALIPTGSTEIKIVNPKVTNYTLVYVTPTSSTNNNVLYVKSKDNGYFTVGFNTPIDIDVNFNWWIIDLTN